MKVITNSPDSKRAPCQGPYTGSLWLQCWCYIVSFHHDKLYVGNHSYLASCESALATEPHLTAVSAPKEAWGQHGTACSGGKSRESEIKIKP